MPEMTVRRAELHDEDLLTEQWLLLLDEQAELDQRFRRSDDAAERWRNEFPDMVRSDTVRVFIAERSATFSGFLTARRWVSPPIYAEEQEVYVEELYVPPSCRGRGAGRALVDAVRRWASSINACRMRLGVLTANEVGRAFWEALDARPLSTTYTISLDGPDEEGSPS